MKFDIFQKHYLQPNPEQIRKDYPEVGSGEAYRKGTPCVSILHDKEKWQDFTKPPNRYNLFAKKARTHTAVSTVPSSPKKL
jgi:hypothetical protein